MFAKPASSATSGEAARRPLVASLVAADVRLSGELVSEGEVHLDGAIEAGPASGHCGWRKRLGAE